MIDRLANKLIEKQIDEWMYRQTDEQTNRTMDRYLGIAKYILITSLVNKTAKLPYLLRIKKKKQA